MLAESESYENVPLPVPRFSKTRSFATNQVLLDPFRPTETQPSSDKSSTCMLQPPQSWKTGPWRFTLGSRF